MTSSNGNIFRVILLAICAENSPVPGEFPTQRPVTRSFDVFFDLCLNKRLRKQSRGWWFETLSCPLWRHRYVNIGSLVLAKITRNLDRSLVLAKITRNFDPDRQWLVAEYATIYLLNQWWLSSLTYICVTRSQSVTCFCVLCHKTSLLIPTHLPSDALGVSFSFEIVTVSIQTRGH